MCDTGTCETCESTDEWIVPADLRAKGPASNSGPPSASQEHAQAALRTGLDRALDERGEPRVR